jgi:hypothetical protein
MPFGPWGVCRSCDLIAYCRLAMFAPHPKVKAVGGAPRKRPQRGPTRGKLSVFRVVEIAKRYDLDRV